MTSIDAASLRQQKQLAASLRTADRKLQAHVRTRLATAVAPVRDEIRANARAVLPKGGGLNEWAADHLTVFAPMSVSSDSVTVTVTVALPGHDLRSLERGRLFHPVYGRRPGGKMVGPQVVPSGFIAKTMTGPVAQRARTAIREALEDLAADLAREART